MFIRSRVIIILLIIVLVGTFAMPSSSRGASLGDLQNQQGQLQKELDHNRSISQQKEVEAKRLGTEVEQLNSDIDTTQSHINETEGQITQVRNNITIVQTDIAKKEGELKVETTNLNQTIVEIYRSARRSNIERLLGSQDLASAIEQTTYTIAVQEEVDRKIDIINKIKDDLNTKKSDLETQNSNLNGLKNQQESQKVALAAQRNSKDQMKDYAETASTQAAAAAREAEKKLGSVNDEIRRAMSSGGGGDVGFLEGKDISKGSVVGYMGSTGNSTGTHLHFEVRVGGSGDGYMDFISAGAVDPVTNCSGYGQDGTSLNFKYGFGYPVGTPFRVTCCFGGYPGHKGLDMNHGPGVMGRPIYAARDGKVVVHRYLNGWGNTVIIYHGSGLWSLYGHML